jgi:opacity protein-like surface antigen
MQQPWLTSHNNLFSRGCRKMRKMAIMVVAAVLLVASAMAQESRSEVSVQGLGLFTKNTTGQGTTQSATDTGGFLVGYRYHFNRWLAGEGVYGYGRNTQQFFNADGLSRVQSNVHQATGGFVVNLPAPARFRVHPYVLAEGGALVFDPTNNAFGTVAGAQRQTVGVFVYGGGADWPLFNHVSLRAEYRGLVYSAPDFGLSGLNTDKITHAAQPSAGIVFRF